MLSSGVRIGTKMRTNEIFKLIRKDHLSACTECFEEAHSCLSQPGADPVTAEAVVPFMVGATVAFGLSGNTREH